MDITLTDRLIDRIDRELRSRDTTIDAWTADHGITPLQLVWMIAGQTRADEGVLFDLRELVGDDMTSCYRQVAA